MAMSTKRERALKDVCSTHTFNKTMVNGAIVKCGDAGFRSMSCLRCVLTCGIKPLFKSTSRWNQIRAWHLYPEILINIASFLRIKQTNAELPPKFQAVKAELPPDQMLQRIAFGWPAPNDCVIKRMTGASSARETVPPASAASSDDEDIRASLRLYDEQQASKKARCGCAMM